MKRLSFILILMAVAISAVAQCYEPSRKEGINQFKQKRFKSAKNIFQSMKSCPDKPAKNDINFWINKCNQALAPQTKREAESFADKMAKYEEYWYYGFCDGLMAVQKKSDIEAWEKGEGSRVSSGEVPNHPKIGFINEKGDLVIPCRYEDPIYYSMRMGYHFSEGMAAVIKKDAEGYGVWGYVDKQGREVIPFEYVDAAPFGEGLAAVAKVDIDTNEWVYYFINKNGERVSDDTYAATTMFSEGLCAVKREWSGKWGYIDKQGNMVIAPQFDYVFNFQDGVAAVKYDENHKDYETALIDKTGRIVDGWKFRPDYCNYSEIRDYIIDSYNAGKYEDTFYAIRVYEKRKRKHNDGKWVGDEGAATTSDDWLIVRILGSLYFYGSEIDKDYAMAAKCWSLVAENDAESAHKLANCYYNGYGVEQDYAKALDLWKSAASNRNSDGVYFYNVGIMYYNGRGTEQNFQTALEWFKKAEDAGYENADQMIEYCKSELRKLLE